MASFAAPFVISSAIALPVIILATLAHTELWQRKEYRLDRIRLFIRNEMSIKVLTMFLIAVAFTTSAWISFLLNFARLAEFLSWLALIWFAAHYLTRAASFGIFRPVRTAKSYSVLAFVALPLVIYIVLLFTPNELPALQLSTLLLFLPLIVAASVGIINIPFALYKGYIISKAKNLRHSLSHITAVGITGSVGKTSAKHFLLQILRINHNHVIATAAHRNSHIGVALDMLEQLTRDTTIYIAEMGAYRSGEIAALTNLVKPQIGIITTIGNQHVGLFGSEQQIANAKWELAEGLPPDGTLILNADSQALKKKAARLSQRIVWFSATHQADIYVHDVKIGPTSISAVLHLPQHAPRPVTISLAGAGSLHSVLAAIAAANVLEVPFDTLSHALERIKPYPHTMEVKQGRKNCTIIDDSYSASEHSIFNAAHHLANFPQKDRRIVLVPLIELGRQTGRAHQRVGRTLANSNAKIYIYSTGQDYRADFLKGAYQVNPRPDFHFFSHPQELLGAVTKNLTADSAVLLEGRIPEIVRSALTSNFPSP